MSFADNLQMGLLGESRIAEWLISRGWDVLPAYEKEIHDGKGPRLFTAEGKIVTPDILVLGPDYRFRWVEAKTKTGWTYYRRNGTAQDGIDRNHWRDYLKVAHRHPWPMWIFFLHREARWAKDPPRDLAPPPAGIYGQSVGKLEGCVDHESDNHGTNGMVYWNRSSLRLIHRLP